MPERKTVQLIGTFGAATSLLAAELARLGYAVGEGEPSLMVVLVQSAEDEQALLAISGSLSPVVAVLGKDDPKAARAAALAGARGLLDPPLRRSAIGVQVALAVAANAHHRRVENKVALLERTIKGRRTVEKAAQLLGTARGITQTDAYEALRKAAMNGRTTMTEIAQSYLSSLEV